MDERRHSFGTRTEGDDGVGRVVVNRTSRSGGILPVENWVENVYKNDEYKKNNIVVTRLLQQATLNIIK